MGHHDAAEGPDPQSEVDPAAASASPSDAGQPPSDSLLAAVGERSSGVSTAVFDQQLRLIVANRRLRSVTEFPEELTAGRPFGKLMRRLGYDTPAIDRMENAARSVMEDGRGLTLAVSRKSTGSDRILHRITDWYRLDAPDGRMLGVGVDFTDVTARERAVLEARAAQQRLTLIDQSGKRIGTSLDLVRTCGELAEVFVPELADLAAVDVLAGLTEGERPAAPRPGEAQEVYRAAVRTHGANAERLAGGLQQQGELFPHAPGSLPLICLSGNRPLLIPDLTKADVTTLARMQAGREVLREGNFHSLILAPLHARSTALGILALVRGRDREPFDEEDLTLAAELAARAAISVDNARAYTHERNVAHTLQRDLLPQLPQAPPGVRPAHRYMASSASNGPAGGDWLDVLLLPDVKTAMVVGDAMGRGVGATALMGQLRTSLRALLFLGLPPDEALWNLDRLTTESGRPELATCLIAVYDPVTGHCVIASAGHPPPLVVTPEGDAQYVDVSPAAPLGVGGVPFDVREVDLADGSLLVLFTDGLLHGPHRDLGEGLDRLRALLADDPAVAEADVDQLCDRVAAHMVRGRQYDDVAVLTARVHTLPADSVAQWPLTPEPQAAGQARRMVREQLRAWGLTDLVDTTELLVSELLTNAVQHGTPPIRIRMLRLGRLRFEISDGGHLLPHLRLAAASDESGRGVRIVSLLASRWGAHRTSAGKTVWFELDLEQAEEPEPDLAALEAALPDGM
ncbi:SpoIIE family protein phosphatase [Streptomyces sp. NPDC059740]|uniref:SpoIIE family protein phosphatase n=1 Tax=Streptomyces sp. NPDC059740 TaxID=3346926 RepID=UPI00365524D4